MSLSQIIHQSPEALAWLHPVAMQKDFVTTWEAQEQAADLAWECGYLLDLEMRQNGRDEVEKRGQKGKPTFNKDVEIYFYEEQISGNITIPEVALRQMDQKPWGMIYTPEAYCKPGEEDGWIGAAEWIPIMPSRGIGVTTARDV